MIICTSGLDWLPTWVDVCYLVQAVASKAGHKALPHRIQLCTPSFVISSFEKFFDELEGRKKSVHVGVEGCDHVRVGPSEFSEVYVFNYKDAEVKANFVKISTSEQSNRSVQQAADRGRQRIRRGGRVGRRPLQPAHHGRRHCRRRCLLVLTWLQPKYQPNVLPSTYRCPLAKAGARPPLACANAVQRRRAGYRKKFGLNM